MSAETPFGWETPCPARDDKQHCNCWYDGKPCCGCEGATPPDARTIIERVIETLPATIDAGFLADDIATALERGGLLPLGPSEGHPGHPNVILSDREVIILLHALGDVSPDPEQIFGVTVERVKMLKSKMMSRLRSATAHGRYRGKLLR